MRIPLTIGVAAWCSILLGATGCAPLWMQRSNAIVDTDPRGAYVLAAEAQGKASGEERFTAALLAGVYAERMDEPTLAREHLAIATSDVSGNPAWIRARAWETSADVEINEAFSRFGKWLAGVRAGDTSSLFRDEMVGQLNQLIAAFAAADADMARAIGLAGEGHDKDQTRRMELIRVAYQGAADNVEAMRDIMLVCAAAAARRDDVPALMGNAMSRRFGAVSRTLKSVCDSCSKKESGGAPGAPVADNSVPGDPSVQPAKP